MQEYLETIVRNRIVRSQQRSPSMNVASIESTTPTTATHSHRSLAMNRHLSSSTLAVFAAILSFALATGIAHAATVTWTGSPDATWTDPDDTNSFSGPFVSGDDVVFDNGGVSPVTISGTVSPALKTFSNTDAVTYTLNGGILAGAGNLVVDGGGFLNLGTSGTSPNPPVLSFIGDTEVSNGSAVSLHYYNNTGAGLVIGLGTGTITLDDGSLGFHVRPRAQASPETLTNPISVGSGGGTLHTRHPNEDNYRSVRTFSGLLTLDGDLAIDNHAYATGVSSTERTRPPNLHFSGGVTVNADAQIANINLGYEYPVNISRITFTGPFSGSGQLTLAASSQAVGDATFWTLQAPTATPDLLSAMRTDGGSIRVATPRLQIEGVGYSYYRAADFSGNGNNTLRIAEAPAQGMDFDTANGGDDTFRIGTGAGQFQTLHLADARRYLTIKAGNEVGNIAIEDGGRLFLDVPSGFSNNHIAGGNFRFLDGSMFEVSMRDTQNRVQYGIANYYLGDGDGTTADTVTLATGDNFIALSNNTNSIWHQDDGVKIRYEALADGARFGWTSQQSGVADLPVMNGAAGTEFAPPASGTMHLAGRASGNVMEISSPATLATAGTVQFMNNPSTGSYALGPVAINNGGSFAIQETDGIVRASAITVDAGGSLSGIGTFDAPIIDVAGSVNPGNSIGTLNLIGDTTFNDGSILEIEIAGRNPGEFDVLNVDGDLTFTETTTLNVLFTNFTPGAIESWDFLTVTGILYGLDNLSLPSNQYFISQVGNTFALNKIPEPSAALLLALGGLALLKRTRKP